MNSYEILGVNKDSSLEEIKKAYEGKVKKIDEEVVDEKKSKAFKKVLTDAYNELAISKNVDESTIVMSKEEFYKLSEDDDYYYDNDEYEDDYYDDDYEYDDEDDYSDRYYEEKNKRKRSSSSSRNKNKRKRRKDKMPSEDEEKYNHYDREHDIDMPWYIALPLKVVAFPVIVILSIIIMIMDVLNMALWIVTKLLIIGSVAVAAIHGYQIYSGISLIKYEIFAACLGVFVVSIILPLIFKTIPKPLKIINNKLKAFVF